MIEQLSIFLENSTGRLAHVTRLLGDAGIDMHVLIVADASEFGVVRIICDDPRRAVQVLSDHGLIASTTPVVAVEVPDRPGGLAQLMSAIGDAGINVEYCYCFVEPNGHAAIDILKVDTAGAEEALAAAGFRVLNAAEVHASYGED